MNLIYSFGRKKMSLLLYANYFYNYDKQMMEDRIGDLLITREQRIHTNKNEE